MMVLMVTVQSCQYVFNVGIQILLLSLRFSKRDLVHNNSDFFSNAADQPIFNNWESHVCSTRHQILSKIFQQHVGYTPSMADIHQFAPCKLDICSTCMNPRYCSYDKCQFPEQIPVMCTKSCSSWVHRQCQEQHQSQCSPSQPVNELLCQECNSTTNPVLSNRFNNINSRRVTRSISRGNTRTFTSSNRQPTTTTNLLPVPNSGIRPGKCCNCHRDNSLKDLPTTTVSSSQIQKRNVKQFRFLSKSSSNVNHNLCNECFENCVNDSKSWEHVWPAWYWALLSGNSYHQSVAGTFFTSAAPIHKQIDPNIIWQMVPDSMRPWWLNAIHQIEYSGPFRPYAQCTLQYPPACFVDKTESLSTFHTQLKSGKFGDLRNAANTEDIMNANVLCPFGCTEHPRQAKHAHLDIVIQTILKNCPIYLYHPHDKLRNFQSMWMQYFRPDGDYDSLCANLSDWLIQPSITFTKSGAPVVLTCRHHDKGSDKYWLYIPRQPIHDLPSSSTDQLCHVVSVPRNTKPTQRKAYNTTFSMTSLQGNYNGVDAFSVSSTSKWNTPSAIRTHREHLALAGRSDINLLLQQKVDSRQIGPISADAMKVNAKLAFSPEDLTQYIDGATYVPASTACEIHLSNAEESDGDHFICITSNDDVIKSCPRSWPRHINIVQMEDSSGYGIAPRTIPSLEGRNNFSSMVTWWLLASISGISELYSTIANQPTHYHVNDWEGHLLAYMSKNILQHNTVWQPRNSPFKKNISQVKLVDRVMNRYVAPDPDESSYAQHYHFNPRHISDLFRNYANVKVLQSFDEIDVNDSYSYDGASIIIIATSELPDPSLLSHYKNHINFRRDDVSFTCRSVVLFHAERNEYNPKPGNYHSISFVRNSKLDKWYKQERQDHLYTKCNPDSDPFHTIESHGNDDDYFPSVFVYVRDQYDENHINYQDKFIESMGGRSHVKCGCNNYPLLPSPRNRQDRLSCMKCHRKESVTCSNLSCPVKLCSTCYKSYPTQSETIIDPRSPSLEHHDAGDDNSIHSSDDNSESSESIPYLANRNGDDDSCASLSNAQYDSDDEEESDVESVFNEFDIDHTSDLIDTHDEDDYDPVSHDHESVSSMGSLMTPTEMNLDDMSSFDAAKRQRERDKRSQQSTDTVHFNSDDVITHSNQDFTLDVPNDNTHRTTPFLSTSAGDTPIDVEQMPNMDTVNGHVIMNQIASCTIRSNKRINGTHRDKFFVQSLCSTTPGKIVPLIYPEAMMHSSIFYAESRQHGQSILGATPLWAVAQGCTKYGFPDPVETTRTRISASGLTQTDKFYRRYLYSLHANIYLSKGDSRKILEKGFTIDNSSRNSRITVNDDSVPDNDDTQDNNDNGNPINQSIDSPNLVLGLSESQRYHKFDYFGTATPNQSRTPGLKHITEWKRSRKWLEKLPGYKYFNENTINELCHAMEEATAPTLFRNWIETRAIFLEQLLIKVSIHGGKCKVFFSRDEYQGESGNLPHMHFVLVVDRTSMPPNAEEILMDAIRASPWEVVKGNDVDALIDDGLMQSIDEIPEVAGLAASVLKHVHDSRCYRRTGAGDGEEHLKCRKMHSLHDTPDCSTHQHIKIPVNYTPEFNNLMERLGFCQADSFGDFKYDHPFFQPVRHMPPCMPNDTTNMSPVDNCWFLFFESMVNTQWIGSANTLAKYLMKYVCKFDKRERIETKANPHTGALQVGSEFLHNTKISSSAYHERRHFERSRNYNHPTGRIIPDIQMYHQLMGLPDVVTNLTFDRISTQSFEIRCQSRVRLKDNGEVRRDGEETTNNGDDTNQEIRRNRVGLAASANDTSDQNNINIDSQTARTERNFPDLLKFTPSQVEIIFDDNISTRVFDRISEYNVRPPELKFIGLKEYFRYFQISKKRFSKDEMFSKLDPESPRRSVWFDGFSRQVRIRHAAISEVSRLVQSQLDKLDSFDDLSDDQVTLQDLYDNLSDMLDIFSKNDEELEAYELPYKRKFFQEFIHDDNGAPLPIISFSPVNPLHVNQWLIHLLLSMGEYICERDAFDHASMRACFRATNLIGAEEDEDSLRRYVDVLITRYILEQVVYYPISLYKAQHYILRAYSILEAVIFEDSTPMFELPYTTIELRDQTSDLCDIYWPERKQKLLDSIYHELSDTSGIPSRSDVMACDRQSPLDWNPVDTFQISESQNQTSYDEQKLALDLIYRSVKKYCGPIQGRRIDTYTKNPIIQGAPGSGKSHMGMHAMLYCLSQGLNVISTALMAARASSIGGVHLHPFFSLNVVRNKSFIKPMRLAELALEKIMRKPHLLYPLLTVDVIFLDEAGQISAELLAVLDIILRHIRKSSVIYGGVLIIGTMDHCQLQPIQATPFLLSSHILTSYTFVQLTESVRASSEPEFRRLQHIIRMNPYKLSEDASLKEEFFRLGDALIKFVDSWDNPLISSNCFRVYSRKNMVNSAITEYVESLIQNFRSTDTPHIISTSRDSQVRLGSRSEWSPASPSTISSMNTQFREPEVLVIYQFGLYEVTENDTRSGYLNSNHVLIYDMPTASAVAQFRSIKVLLKPPELQHVDWLESSDTDNYPSKQHLLDNGWKEISIKICQEREVTVSGGFRAKRKQYAIKHIGASTIDNAQGKTIYTQLGFECSPLNSPWMKSQIVVISSRTKRPQQMVCIGHKSFALQKMWDLITTPNQWTQTMDRIIHMLSINSSGPCPDHLLPSIPDVYPFRIRDMSIPIDSTGFVYLLCSMKDSGYTYIGQCQVLSTRLNDHNSGNGSLGTSDSSKYPLFVAGYITGLRHYSKQRREQLESHWQRDRDAMTRPKTVLNILDIGERLVQNKNISNMRNGDYDRIHFIRLVGLSN